MAQDEIRCGHCDLVLSDIESICPDCNTKERILFISFEEDANLRQRTHESLECKVKDSTKTGKKKMTMEFFQGHQKSKKMGTWVIKERIINREHDKYYEHIEDEGGTLIHHCDEKLSEHQGHGSAKLLKKENLNE